MKRTCAQNRRIWGLVAKLTRLTRLPHEECQTIMRDINAQVNATRRTSTLSVKKADRLIAELEALVRRTRAAAKGGGADTPVCDSPPEKKRKLADLITPDQQRVLQHLYEDAGIVSPQGFNRRVVKKPWPQTVGDAIKLYQALEQMILAKYRPDELLGMIGRVKPRWEQLENWEREFLVDVGRQITQEAPLSAHKVSKIIEIHGKVCG